jgi:hypothetical protein
MVGRPQSAPFHAGAQMTGAPIAPRGPGGDARPARPALSVLCSVAVLLLAEPRGHCTTDQTKVAAPETPAVSFAVTVTV